jgi:hypothetical protein
MKYVVASLLVLALAGITFAGSDWRPTLILRWEQPSAQDNPAAVKCGVTEKELKQAVRVLTTSLKPGGMDVELGYYAAKEPSDNPNARGRLWINSVPLETWLAKTGHDGGGDTGQAPVVENSGCGDITADHVFKAGQLAAEQLKKSVSQKTAAASSSKSAQ